MKCAREIKSGGVEIGTKKRRLSEGERKTRRVREKAVRGRRQEWGDEWEMRSCGRRAKK